MEGRGEEGDEEERDEEEGMAARHNLACLLACLEAHQANVKPPVDDDVW